MWGKRRKFPLNIDWKAGVTGTALKACHWWEDNIKMDLNKTVEECGLYSCNSGKGQILGCCEHGHEPSVSIKREEFPLQEGLYCM